MKKSKQDQHYVEKEGDDFFSRNFEGKPAPDLRLNKKTILDQLLNLSPHYARVLEYGCNYGDLLNHLKSNGVSQECVGIEASRKAIQFGQNLYGDKVVFHQGTIATNPLNDAGDGIEPFDLVIVDDVFGWVSRETIFQSVANIDNAIREGGFLFIRDFFPNGKVKNANHHVKDGSVFNFKVPGSHTSIFLASGVYEVVSQKIFMDRSEMSSGYKSGREFESRWADTILKKSTTSYFIG
jgi:SAM-dependent methyltransferase